MDQESFESLIKSKFDQAGVRPPDSVWQNINASLNESAVKSFEASQNRYKWLAVAAVFVAVFSFALNVDFLSEEQNSFSSYNALLPTSNDHFRFYEPVTNVQVPRDNSNLWSNVVFVEPKEAKTQYVYISEEIELPLQQTFVYQPERIDPQVNQAAVHSEMNTYYVPQYHNMKSKAKSRTSFWAGVEAGAGNFDPDFSGGDALAASVDFDALASTLGQSGFVNPTSSATQNSMTEGVVTSFGVDFGMKMGNRWTLESGVQYANVNNQSTASLNVVDVYTISTQTFNNDNDLGPPIIAPAARQTEVEENFEHSVNLDNNLRFTSIPLKAGYYLMDNKLSLRLNAGIAANYLISNQLSDPTGQLTTTDQPGSYNEWSFDGLTGFELGVNVLKNFNLTFEPNYRQSITPISRNLNNRSGFMVQTGFRYTIN